MNDLVLSDNNILERTQVKNKENFQSIKYPDMMRNNQTEILYLQHEIN